MLLCQKVEPPELVHLDVEEQRLFSGALTKFLALSLKGSPNIRKLISSGCICDLISFSAYLFY